MLALTAAIAMGSQSAIGADDGMSACKSDAMIVFDASGSMATSDYTLKLPRIAQAKQSMAKVIPEVAPLRKLGLIVYGEGEYNDCTAIALRLRPTVNAAEPLLRIVERINPRGKTPLTESIRAAGRRGAELHRARGGRGSHHRRRGNVRRRSVQGGDPVEEGRVRG